MGKDDTDAQQNGQAVPLTKEKGTTDDELRNGFIHHTVQAGETIYRLTINYGVTGEEIYQANPVLRSEPLKAGQVVLIPDKKSQRDEAEAKENARATGSEAEKTAYADDKKTSKGGYKIKGAYGSRAEQTERDDKSDGESFWSRLFGKKKKTDTPSAPLDDSMCEHQHVVVKGETVYSISRYYGITEAMLLAANPTVTAGNLKRGQVLCIPYRIDLEPASDDDDQPVVVTPPDTPDVTPAVPRQDQPLQVALILPFMLDENTVTPTADQAKMVEFYEGFLLAVDSLRDSGVSLELYVFDSGDASRSLSPILEKEEMANMDIIFGPMHAPHVAQAADFSRAHAIPLVLPFSRGVAQLAGNPYLWQVNADPAVIEQEGITHLLELFPKPNVLFFQTKGVTDSFCTHLQRELDSRGMAYSTFPADTTSNVRPFMEACSRDDDADNLLILTSSDNASLAKMLPVFQLIMRDTAQVADIHLYGYPQYQTYATAHSAALYELDTWYHTAFYTHPTRPDAAALSRKFTRMYGRDMTARYPRYGMLGFDIAHWFLRGLAHRGPAPAEAVFAGMTTYRCSTVQTGFSFNRVGTTGGYTNTSVYVVHMRPDGQIFKVDFDF